MSETETVPTDATTGLPLDDVRIKNINYGPFIDSGSDEKNIREATGLTGEGREPKPYEWSGSGLHESGPSESAHAQMRRAANMMGNKRREDFADELQARSGIDADTAAAVTDHITDGPPPAVRATRTDGTYLPDLRDDVPILDQLQGGNDIPRSQLKLATKTFRDQQAIEAQQLLWELGQRQEQQRASEEAIGQAAQQPPFPPPKTVESAPAPQPQQADPLHAERAALVQAQATASAIQQMTRQEAALLTDIERHEAQCKQAYPELWNAEAFERVKGTNPTRYATMVQEAQRSNAARQQLAALTTNRMATHAGPGDLSTRGRGSRRHRARVGAPVRERTRRA